MTNANKNRGDVFERVIRDHLDLSGFAVRRTRAGYERDAGDLHVLVETQYGWRPKVIVQAKNRAAMRFGEWLTGLVQQRDEAKASHGVLVVKRRGVGAAGRQYAVMELDDLIALLREAGYANGPPP